MAMTRIIIAGEGGQGVQVMAKILIEAAYHSKKQVSYLPNFGVEQRGGVSLAHIQISELPISFPRFRKADIAVVMAERAIPRIERYFGRDTSVVFDNSIVQESKLGHLQLEKVAIPATYIAKTKLVPLAANVVLLGALSGILGLKFGTVKTEMEKVFAPKYKDEPQLKHFNEKALEIGSQTIKELVKK